jgi:hypothetical protein
VSSIVASEPAACRPILVDFVDTGSNLSSPFPLGLTFGFLPYRRKPATHFRSENSHLESIQNYSSSIIQRQTTNMGVCPNRLVLINSVSPAL